MNFREILKPGDLKTSFAGIKIWKIPNARDKNPQISKFSDSLNDPYIWKNRKLRDKILISEKSWSQT